MRRGCRVNKDGDINIGIFRRGKCSAPNSILTEDVSASAQHRGEGCTA